MSIIKLRFEQTKALFENTGIDINPRSLMRNLSVAQIQLIEIIKAISLDSKVVIMDEPTSAITFKEVDTLFDQIRKLKAKGVGIIYISHKMEEISEIADRITVLRDGKWIGTDFAQNLEKEKIIKMMVGREIKEVYPKVKVELGDVALEVRNLLLKDKFQKISFSLRKGEVLGVAGLVGAGRSELVETIFGITKPEFGEVLVNGKPIKMTHPKYAIRNKIALITEDRSFTGLNLKTTVEHNISSVQLSKLARFGVINNKLEGNAVEQMIEKLRIKAFSP